MNITRIVIIFLRIFLPIAAFSSEFHPGIGSSSGRFLMISPGARSAALGDAVTSLNRNIESLFGNPAGMAAIDQRQLNLFYSSLYEGLHYSTASFALPVSGAGIIGFGIIGLLYGDIQSTTLEADGGLKNSDIADAADFALIVGYARALTKDISFGISIKNIYQVMETERAYSLGFDIGEYIELVDVLPLLGKNKSPLHFGAVVQNVGTKLKFVSRSYDLPFMVRLGMSYAWMKLAGSGHSSVLFMDMEKPADDNVNLSLGIEYRHEEWIALRTGYKIGYYWNRLALGAGIRIGISKFTKMKIDYAFIPFEKLGNTHQIGILLDF